MYLEIQKTTKEFIDIKEVDTLKRCMDFLITLILVILFLPFMFLIACLVKWKHGSPIIFKQLRPGLHGEPFYFYKFRTMTDQKDKDGRLLPDADRLTKVGLFLRRYSLDELPQLFNVLKGDLSLVGPRPLLMDYLSLYTPEQARRHDVKPGITGWAQINGRNAIDWETKFALDVWYVDHHSFLFDLKILGQTFIKVFKREGISQPGHVTVETYKGISKRMEGEG